MTVVNSGRACPVGTVRWLAVAIAAVAVLHGVQCAAGMAAPLLAPPAVVHATSGRTVEVATAVVTAAEHISVPPSSALDRRATVGAREHRRLPAGAGAAAGACLMLLLTAVAGLLLASLTHRQRPGPGRATGVAVPWRPGLPMAPRLDLLCVSRT